MFPIHTLRFSLSHVSALCPANYFARQKEVKRTPFNPALILACYGSQSHRKACLR